MTTPHTTPPPTQNAPGALQTTPTTGAELQTLREACNLTREALAELVGVQARTIKHWENGRSAAPEDVAHTVKRLAFWVLRASAQTEAQARAMLAHSALTAKSPPVDGAGVVLLRYRQTADMALDDRLNGLRADVHAASVARVALALQASGHTARVVWFEPEAYAQWAAEQGHTEDSSAHRAAWAAAHGLTTPQARHRPD